MVGSQDLDHHTAMRHLGDGYFCLKAAASRRKVRNSMRAEVKRLWSTELELLDARSLPSNPDDCCVGMQADIGPVGEEGADTFDFEVCTPSGLAARLDADGRPYWARGTLVLSSFSWEAVEAAVNQYVRSVSGEDWAEVAGKLSRFLLWEFEDYRPNTGG